MANSNSEMTEVGRFLKQLRFERDEGQEEMAEKLGVTKSYISLLGSRQAIPKTLVFKVIKEYNLDETAKAKFIDIVTRDVVRRFWGSK